MRRLIRILIPVIFLLGGCAGIGELRQTEPTRVGSFNTDYRKLATCSAVDMEEKFSFSTTLRIYEAEKKARVYSIESSTGMAIYDFLFIDENGTSTKVEGRGANTIEGRDAWPANIWPIITKCADKNPM
jgi:hypothetical protein